MLAHTIQAVVLAIATVAVVVLMIWIAVGCVRWAKRDSTGSQVLAGAMLFVVSFGIPIVQRPEQGVEDARQDKAKKGADSGDPPDDSISNVYDGQLLQQQSENSSSETSDPPYPNP